MSRRSGTAGAGAVSGSHGIRPDPRHSPMPLARRWNSGADFPVCLCFRDEDFLWERWWRRFFLSFW
mgnify:CR=1 FL=1